MKPLLAFSRVVDDINTRVGRIADWLTLIAVVVSAGNAFVRYGVSWSSNALLEVQWYFFAGMVMLGAPYTLLRNEHVRVDILYGSMGERARLWVDILGIIVFLLPAMALPMLWRVGRVADAAAESLPLGGLLAAAGLLSLLAAALALWRRQDPGRLIGWAGIGQTGLAALCFGLDLPLAGILALAGQALSRCAAGLALQPRGTAPELPGGAAGFRAGRWGLLLALAGLSGLPPFPGFAALLAVAMALASSVRERTSSLR